MVSATPLIHDRRYRRGHPCPICNGHKDLPAGKGVRCAGYSSGDGQYAHCTREEYAGQLQPTNAIPATYAHRLRGECHCGVTHGSSFWTGHITRQKKPAVVTRYKAIDQDGMLVGIHTRKDYLYDDGTPYQDKVVWWEQHKGRSSIDMPLYNLPALLSAPPNTRVFLVEGEKAAESLTRGGALALGTMTGAEVTPCDESLRPLLGHPVVLWADNDDVGRLHMQRIATRLVTLGTAPDTLAQVNWPDAPTKGDAANYLGTGGTIAGIEAMLQPFTACEPENENENNENNEISAGKANSFFSFNSFSSGSRTYPKPLGVAAFYGLAGEIVQAIAPHTEADEVALLVQLLVSFGNAVGRNAYALAEASHHYPSLYVALVGNTAKGRKGSSWAQILQCMAVTDATWVEQHLASGLSSGEGLIHMLRDTPPESPARDAEPLLSDKRLLIHQGEFASVLKMMARDGNTLSDILRLAWDGVPLRVLTKQAPERATATHVSLIGHITRNELLRYLTETEAGNGFGNRFLWVCVARSKLLPDGGSLTPETLTPLVGRLQAALDYVRDTGERMVTRDPDARAMWHQQYGRLSDGLPGLLGAMLARAEAQVMRLSMIYALLDKSHIVKKQHLEAALALWDYTEASARYIFGDALGDPVADAILLALRNAGKSGLTRTEISALFGRNKGRDELQRALRLLADERLAYAKAEETGGRASERWHYGTPMAQ